MAIREADIAGVWRAYEEFTRRYEELRTDDGLRRYHTEFFAATAYEGIDGYQRWFEETMAPFESVDVEVRLALNYTMRDGRIVRIEVFLDPEKAQAAARATA